MSADRSSSPTAESRGLRTRVLLVGADVRMRALAAQARRLGAQVSEAPTVAEALAAVGEASAREPIGGVVVCVRTPDFDHEVVAAAFETVMPGLPVHAAASSGELGVDPELIVHGFERSIELPASDDALTEMLRDADVLPPRRRGDSVPGVSRVVELAVEQAAAQARERAREAEHEYEDGSEDGSEDEQPIARSDRGRASASESAPTARRGEPQAAPTRRRADEPEPEPTAAVRRPRGDADLAHAIAEGEPVEPLALEVIRMHLGSDDVRFASRTRPAEREAVAKDRRDLQVAEVYPAEGSPEDDGFGVLLSTTIAAGRLAPWAAWLAAWLRLEERHLELKRLAVTDELTGAGNRRGFRAAFERAREHAARERRTLSLMYFDLDDFKQYNERFGHETGDEVLRETVELLRSVIRSGDDIFRLGGDEFVVLFCDDSPSRRGASGNAPESIQAIAERFRRALAELSLSQLGDQGAGRISVSGGVAVWPWHGYDAEDLLRKAEARSRQSKSAGKNVITFGPAPDLDEGTSEPPSSR